MSANIKSDAVDSHQESEIDWNDEDSDEEGVEVEGSEDKKYNPTNLFQDPLSLIDPNANLEAALNARSISEAIHILSPNLPGCS